MKLATALQSFSFLSPVLAKTYRPTVERLSEAFRVITVELPGSGRAEHVNEGWSGALCQVVGRFHRTNRVDRPTVIGHSRSGAIAVTLAADYPKMVGKLVIVDATGTGPHSLMQIFGSGSIDLFLDLRLFWARGITWWEISFITR